MAAVLHLLPPANCTTGISYSLFKPQPSNSSFVFPTKCPWWRLQRSRDTRRRTPVPIFAAARAEPAVPSTKIGRCPSLDRHATRNNRLRFVRKLTTLLLSKPRHFLPLRILSRCRAYLRPTRPLLQMILRYPAIFRIFRAPSASHPSSLSVLAVGLTPAAAALAEQESLLRASVEDTLAAKLQRLLMLSSHRRLVMSKLVHLGPDLGLPVDFRSRLCNRHSTRFRTVDTSYGRALELVHWDDELASPILLPDPRSSAEIRPIIDRPQPKFRQLRLRKGLNLKRRHQEYLLKFQDLPEVSPYSLFEDAAAAELLEKRAVAVVREVLAMTVEKRTLVDHLTHFRKEFGLPNKLRGLLVRHPEMFYISLKGKRDSVFLVEGYDAKGKLVEEDELLTAQKSLLELVREGKNMRRDRKNSTDYYPQNNEDEQEDSDDEEDGNGLLDDGGDDDDNLEDLFENENMDDWTKFTGYDDLDVEELNGEEVEFWSALSHHENVSDYMASDGSNKSGELQIW